MKTSKTLLNLFIGAAFCMLASQVIVAQTEKLGAIKYTPPKGWAKAAKDHAVVFSEINQAKGNFCFITLYAEASSIGTPQQDFAKEWKARVVEPWGGEVNPKTETEKVDGWTAMAGGAQIDFQGNKAFAFLNVLSGFGKTVTVLAILNDEAYLPPFQAFVESMDIDKTVAAVAASTTSASVGGPPQRDDFGRLIIPLPTHQLTIADLAGQWGENAGINTRYVYRDSGTYAGADSLHFTAKMTLTADGGYYNDFWAIQNGKGIKEKTSGSFAIAGRVIVIKQNNLAKYVIRGWLELPDMTILEVCGPWYDDQAIPAEIFSNPNQGANLNSRWVRKK
jgi:hypothetical protein